MTTQETEDAPQIARVTEDVTGATLNVGTRKLRSLNQGEFFWRDHSEWLETKGYRLRARYQPGWGPDLPFSQLVFSLNQDFFPMARTVVVDAIRIRDGKRVMLKWISKMYHPHEVELTDMFNTKPLAGDSRNHCVHLEELFHPPDDPDQTIAVFPFLQQIEALRFDTVGEVVDFLSQIFTGLQFMHHSHVAHRDINANNIMMDGNALFPEGWNQRFPHLTPDGKRRAKVFTRTQRPPKYYFIDLGLSRQYDPSEANPLEPAIFGGDKTVPEFRLDQELFNPFHTDIYYIGNLIREYILEGSEIAFKGHVGLDFLKPLVSDMVQDDPTKRPTIDEVVKRFEEIYKKQSSWKLRSRPAPRRENIFKGIPHQLGHWKRRIGYIVRRVHPVPFLAQ